MKKIILVLLTLSVSQLCFAHSSLPYGTQFKACDANGKKCVAIGTVDLNFGNAMYAYYTDNGPADWELTKKVVAIWRPFGFDSLSCDSDIVHCVADGWQMVSAHGGETRGLVAYTDDGGRSWAEST